MISLLAPGFLVIFTKAHDAAQIWQANALPGAGDQFR